MRRTPLARRSPLVRSSSLRRSPLPPTGRRLPAASPRRAAENRIYSKRRDVWLAERPACQRCGARTGCLHHRAGRGARLLDERYWAASCWDCNEWAETHTGAALAEGWLLSYINPERAA